MTAAATRYVGQSVPRVEDRPLLTGKAPFTADINLTGQLHAAVLRSIHAHARIKRVHLDAARALPGVVAAFDGAALRDAFPVRVPPQGPRVDVRSFPERVLASGKVRYVGEAVAAVVAESRRLAEDAVELIEVEYEPLTPVLDLEAALKPEAPLVHEESTTNLAGQQAHSTGDPDQAIRDAPHTLRERVAMHRGAGHALETRAVLASYETKTGQLTVWATTQGVHRVHGMLCRMLRMPEHRVRVITPFVGGGFGPKGGGDIEVPLVCWLARHLDRPVKWVEDRLEHSLSAKQERDQVHDITVGFDDTGRILGMKVEFLHDAGAYGGGIIVPWITATTIVGPYKVPNYGVTAKLVYLNKTPASVVRGAGRPQAVFVMERTIESIARKLGLDRVEVRKRNMVQPEDQPYDAGLIFRDNRPMVYDGGDYPATLDMALDLVHSADFEEYRREAAREGRCVGLGMAVYVEGTGLGPFEGATVRLETDGTAVVYVGSVPQGQGHHTVFSQICADQLGIPMSDVVVLTGDTATLAKGIGTFGSRSTVVGGSAVHLAAGKVREQVLQIAASMLEADPRDLVIEDGSIYAAGNPAHATSVREVAQQVSSGGFGFISDVAADPVLEGTSYFRPEKASYACGAAACVVEVDPDTGFCHIERYATVEDSARLINPMIVHGQSVGGVAHGIGNAMYEEVAYDELGQPLTVSFMDYLLPTAMEVPSIRTGRLQSVAPRNPLGVKGAGEGGTLPAPACIALAVEDALRDRGVHVTTLPLTPYRLRTLIEEADRRKPDSG